MLYWIINFLKRLILREIDLNNNTKLILDGTDLDNKTKKKKIGLLNLKKIKKLLK